MDYENIKYQDHIHIEYIDFSSINFFLLIIP